MLTSIFSIEDLVLSLHTLIHTPEVERITRTYLLFCSTVWLLVAGILRSQDAVDGVVEMEVFMVEQMPLFYCREQGSYLNGPKLKPLRHPNVAKQAI